MQVETRIRLLPLLLLLLLTMLPPMKPASVSVLFWFMFYTWPQGKELSRRDDLESLS